MLLWFQFAEEAGWRGGAAGLLLDKLGSSLRNAFLIQIVACAVALVSAVCAFMLTQNLAGFVPVFTLALIGLFVTSAPLCAHLRLRCSDGGCNAWIRLFMQAMADKTSLAWLCSVPHLNWPWHQREQQSVTPQNKFKEQFNCADAVSMWAVPIPNRPAAQAMQVITMHALGDVPSPPIVGAIQGAPACQAALVLLHGGVQ